MKLLHKECTPVVDLKLFKQLLQLSNNVDYPSCLIHSLESDLPIVFGLTIFVSIKKKPLIVMSTLVWPFSLLHIHHVNKNFMLKMFDFH